LLAVALFGTLAIAAVFAVAVALLAVSFVCCCFAFVVSC
jgi:hypothetical protein